MKRFLVLLTSLGLLLAVSTTSFAYEKSPPNSSADDTYFIAFQSKIDKNVIKLYGGEVKYQYKYIPVVTAKLPEKAIRALSKNPNIAYIEKDATAHATSQVIPWGVIHVNATETQDLGYTGKGMKVGVIDTGIDYTHEDLHVKDGASFVNGTTDYFDDNGHGTHVAGTIAALDNEVGVLGIAPQADLYAIKVLDQNGSGTYSDIVAGIEWAIEHNINILNMSLGGTVKSKTLEKAVNKAYESNILLVASAGNNGYEKKSTITYPAAYTSVIAVGAVDENNTRASFSSVGRELELMAPGVDVLSTVPYNSYASYNGTSMASPHVVGIAALAWEAKPNLTNVQLRNLLNETVKSIGDSFEYGKGLVDGFKVIDY